MFRQFATMLFVFGLPLAAQVKETAAYRYQGGLQEASRRQARLALPSLQFQRALPAAYRLPDVAAAELALEPKPMATRAGIHRPVKPAAPLESGRWDVSNDGRALWRMVLQSPGAAGIRLHFRDFRLGGGGRLWLHDGSGQEAEIMGPYEDRGIYGDGEFWSDFVLSDTIVIEYQPAPSSRAASGADPLPFTIAEISHLLPGVLPEAGNQDLANAFPELSLAPRAAEAVSRIVSSLASPLGWAAGAGPDPRQAAAACHLDISCYPEWADTARAVAHFVFEDDGHSYVCSGTLLSTTTRNNTPYFLTADHCVSTEAVARTVETFWQYQTARCNGPVPNKRDAQRTLGARYLTSEGVARGDYSLLLLNSVPAGVTFSGWSADEVRLGAQIVGIHHPSGDYKRFSRGARVTTGGQITGANPAFYYTVSYNEGLIEGGSSGSGIFTTPGVLVGSLSTGPKSATPCNIKPFPGNYGKFSDAFPKLRDYLEGRTTEPGNPPPGGGGGGAAGLQILTSGTAREFTVGPVTSPTLLGAAGYAIDVPAGSTRLEIRLAVAAGQPELGFFVRFGSAPAVQDGRAVSDFQSPGFTGSEVLTIDARSNPVLRPGRYYITLGLFTLNATVRGTISATVSGGGGGTAPPATNQLVSGVARSFSLAPVTSGTLLNGANGFRIEVPAGARRLDIRLAGSRPELDIDLFVRLGSDPVVAGNSVTADHASTGDTGVEELSITQASTPPLRAGTYYVALGLFARNVTVTGTITATITGGDTGGGTPGGGGNTLVSGTPVVVTTPAVTGSTLRSGANAYQITVPAGATRLDVRLSNGTAGIDYDLFVRRASAPDVQGNNVVADYRSTSDTGDELVSITSASSPPLQPGSTYFIAIGIFTTGREGRVSLTATVTGGSGGGTPETPPPAGGTGTQLRTGTPARLAIPAATVGRLLAGANGYYVAVPTGTQRLELQLNSQTPDVDLDLFVTAGAAPAVQGGKVQAEYRATGPSGSESIVITGTPAQPLSGNYFIGIGVFTPGVNIDATLTAATSGGAASGPIVLRSGVAQAFSLPAVAGAQLAPQGYAIDIPANALRLEIRLNTTTPGVDVDLYARHSTAPTVSAGKVQADHSSEGPSGAEVLTIVPNSQPALRAGRYFVNLAIFSTGTAIDGSLVATLVTGGVNANDNPPPPRSRDITPQVPVKFNLPAVENPTLFTGDYSFRLVVPEGTRSMQLRLSADTPSIDTDMYVRYEADVDLSGSDVVADYAAESDSGNEVLTVGPTSQPALRPGVYYVALGLFARNTPASGSISVIFERGLGTSEPPPQSSGRTLTYGQAAQFRLPSVSDSTLFYGDYAYRINVPNARGRLEVAMRAADPAVDVDLYLRHGSEPTVENGRTVADHRATGDTGDETVVVSNVTTPALRTGVYFVAFGLFTPNREASGTLTATFIPESQPAGGVLKEYDLTPERVAAPEEALTGKSGFSSTTPLGADAKAATGSDLETRQLLRKRSAKGSLSMH